MYLSLIVHDMTSNLCTERNVHGSKTIPENVPYILLLFLSPVINTQLLSKLFKRISDKYRELQLFINKLIQ